MFLCGFDQFIHTAVVYANDEFFENRLVEDLREFAVGSQLIQGRNSLFAGTVRRRRACLAGPSVRDRPRCEGRTGSSLVQMLLVAFSRRMCCSRVCSVSTQHRLPRRSVVWPTRPAGHAAEELLAAGDNAQVRPAVGPWDCPAIGLRPRRISVRYSPGRLSRSDTDRIDGRDQQGPGLVGDFGKRFHIFQAAEKVRMLRPARRPVSSLTAASRSAGEIAPCSVFAG